MFDLEYWQDRKQTDLFLNPRLHPEIARLIKDQLQPHLSPGHIYLQTSGTSQSNEEVFRIVELSKQAMLESAKSVNAWIGSDQTDVWVNSLPHFHVGGLSIYCRAALSGARVVNYDKKWDPQKILNCLLENVATLTSFVPTQVFDIVNEGIFAPDHLRLCFIGGGALSKELRQKALKLNWPIIETYGMTEFCSQVATEPLSQLGKPDALLEVLPHLTFRVESGELQLKGRSRLTRYIEISKEQVTTEDIDPDTWFATNDGAVLIRDRNVEILGRISRVVKVSGELVNLSRIEELAKDFWGVNELVVLSLSDERLENRLILAGPDQINIEKVKEFNSSLLPFERMSGFFVLDDFPRTPLGKPMYKVMEMNLSTHKSLIRKT